MVYPKKLEKITDKYFLELFLSKVKDLVKNETLLEAYKAELNFYEGGFLIRGEFKMDGKKQSFYFLNRYSDFFLLDFTNKPIYKFNNTYGIQLNENNALDYLCFFFSFVRGRHGAFIPLLDAQELLLGLKESLPQTPENADAHNEVISFADIPHDKIKETVHGHFTSPKVSRPNKIGPFEIDISLLFKDSLFYSLAIVETDGLVSLSNETIKIEGFPIKPDYDFNVPELKRTVKPYHSILNAMKNKNPLRKTDADTLKTIVKVLLSEALEKHVGHILFASSGAEKDEKKPLKQFASMVMHTRPVVVFESQIPYIEETIAELLAEETETFLHLQSAQTHNAENGLLKTIQVRNGCLLTLPMHSFRGIENENRVARDITATNASVFIGCNSFQSVPFMLRELTDFVLTLPEINQHNFKKIYALLFTEDLPKELNIASFPWANMLLPNDIIQAIRLKLSHEETLKYMKQRVDERLAMIVPNDSPALSNLHGLGEARVIVEDLIKDIKDAQKGKIGWNQVDKGMLLVGPPGTGKTTLAKAIAKEAGIKFIHASASQWQDVDHLGQHIAKISSSFSLARRYAPSIMFIDEFDSIGTREKGADKNIQYQNVVINTILQEIQGFVEKEKVIIIGATNYMDMVDPALRRAGRLDRTVHVSYPTVDALDKIYQYYLKQYSGLNKMAENIDVKELASISFGLTGADVEQIVRGALRRARKEAQKLNQIHFLNEITGKPRDTASSHRIKPEEMQRIAVHEAGHALLRILNNPEDETIAYISIVPRNDGKLGFVASIPSTSISYTEEEYYKMLEIMLAGRAAEEVIYNKEGISSGSGGVENSDLAKATNLASSVVARYGFGKSSGLFYSSTIRSEQIEEVRELLSHAYQSCLKKIVSNQGLLQRLIDLLIEKQEVTGKELMRIIKKKSHEESPD